MKTATRVQASAAGESREPEDAVMTDTETFVAPWPGVLVEMKDFIDLWFLVGSGQRRAAHLRIYISRLLVSQGKLQPHAREFKAAVSRIPCRIELKATSEPAHRVEIEYRR